MLKRVSIQNFKSLKDVTLDLQKVNLLIGPNNSGKTNFLKALEIFQTTERFNNIDIEDVAFKKIRNSNVEVRLVSDYKEENWDGYYTYENFSCRINSLGNCQKIVWYQKENEPGVTINESNIDAAYFKKTIGFPKIYKPNPNKLDKPGPVGRGDVSVAADVSNLIAFFDRIRDEHSSVFSQIKTDLAKCLPEFTEINFQNVESTEELIKQFGDKTFKRIGLTDGRQDTIYWADELSEGTLYFIALLCIINQPNPPKLLLLEEPEKGIHPRRIREVMDFIFRLAEEKDVQIILTTHNENVLNEFTSLPEAVFVFEKDEEGATHIKNLLTDIIEPSRKRSEETGTKEIDFTSNLGENWMYGLLGGVPEEAL